MLYSDASVFSNDNKFPSIALDIRIILIVFLSTIIILYCDTKKNFVLWENEKKTC